MGNNREIPNSIHTEIQSIAADFSNQLADTVYENNYIGLSLYTMVLPAILSEVTDFVLPQTGAIGPVWNYLDATCSAITGVNQLLDDTNHRPRATKIKGAVNIASSVEIILLTAISFSLLSGPSFAAAFGAGFLISLDETARAFARKYDFEYWLKDSLAQLEKQDAVQKKLQDEIDILERANKVTAGSWALNRKKERLSKLIAAQRELEKDVFFRVAAGKPDSYTVVDHHIKACSENFLGTSFMQDLLNINNWKSMNPSFLKQQYLVSELEIAQGSEDSKERKIREQEIAKKCNDHVISAVKDSFILGLAFTGMLLACIPGCQLVGLILVGIASGIYLVKNMDKLRCAAKKCSSYFFGSRKENVPSENKNNENLNSSKRFVYTLTEKNLYEQNSPEVVFKLESVVTNEKCQTNCQATSPQQTIK